MNGTATAPAGVQPICRTFRGEPDQVPLVRDFVRRHLGEKHHCPEAILNEILLCVSETATNAIRHTFSGSGGHFTVVLRAGDSTARIDVIDGGPIAGLDEGHSDIGDADDLLPPGGMGLRLVSAHSDRMGFDEVDHRGVAWFERTWTARPRP